MLYIPNPDPWLPTLNRITSDIADALVFVCARCLVPQAL